MEHTPQLPGSVYGVAYEDAMGGVSVDVCLDEDDVDELMEKHTDPELVCVVPAALYPMELIRNAPDLLAACEHLLLQVDEFNKHWKEYEFPHDTKLHGLAVCLNNRAGDLIREAVKKAKGES
jgi:hypothetical protein